MALLPEELHNYNHSGLIAMSDMLVEIEERQINYSITAKFLQELQELRWDIDREIDAGLNDMEEIEATLKARPG